MKKCSDCIFITYSDYCTCNDMESLIGEVCTDYREHVEYDELIPTSENYEELYPLISNEQKYKETIIIAPGETIKDEIDYLGMSHSEFANAMQMTEKEANLLLSGNLAIHSNTALKLEDIFDIPASLWNSLEAQYRESLNKICY